MSKNTTPLVEEAEFTPEEDKAMLRMHETDVLAGLLAAGGFRDDEQEIIPIEIVRNDKVVLTFRMRPLDEKEYDTAKERNTRYKKNKNLGGMTFPEKTDTVRYRSELIYTATIPEDRDLIWHNKEAWRKYNVLSGPDLITRVLKAGEKDRICDILDRASGYETWEESGSADDRREDVAKN